MNSTDRACGPESRRWWALGTICLVQVMLLLDVTVVNIALPPVQRDLGFSSTGLAWVVNGYTVTYGGLLILGGRLGDLLGRRRMFLTGLGVFALSSAAAGFAPDAGMLVAARLVQGGAVFEYIEAWYNPHRRHSTIGMLSPVQFEQHHLAHAIAA